MNYESRPPQDRPVQSDPYFTLMADADGVGFIHCGDAVAVVPLTAEPRSMSVNWWRENRILSNTTAVGSLQFL